MSAGFDAHRDDPLAELRVTEAGFAAMAASLRAAGAELGACRSGWCSRAATTWGRSRARWPRRWRCSAADRPAAAADVAVHPLAVEAAARAARYWPGLAGVSAG